MQTNLILVKKSIQTFDQLQLWEIPQETTKDQWSEGHKQLLLMQRVVKKLLPKSQSFGVLKFGLDSLLETEAQFQLEFQLPATTSTPKPEGEPDAFNYLEKGFMRWAEKAGDINSWDNERLVKALEILKPITSTAERIRKVMEKRNIQ